MPVFRIDLAYDGTGFRGWARNAGVRSIQGEIEAALGRVLGGEVALSVAGRTDAGVHARHQVASFSWAEPIAIDATLRSLRTMLGPEVSFQGLNMVADEFDARFSARQRSYRYFIDEAPAHDPLRARWVWHRGEIFDLGEMNRAAAHFVGAHDFASLCRASATGGTERTVESAFWDRVVSPEPSRLPPPASPQSQSLYRASDEGLLVFAVSARAFCHQMVRSMVALCVEVGRGRLPAGAVPTILEARDRNAARGVAPAHGLVLWGVEY